MASSTTHDRADCVFCEICDDKTPDGLKKLLYSDDGIVVFRDKSPVAEHHYLIVPRAHIPSAKHLSEDHLALVEGMVQIAHDTLKKQNACMSDIRLGFHWPPFNTVKHLHLHAISPTDKLSLLNKFLFRENTFYFVSTDYILKALRPKS